MEFPIEHAFCQGCLTRPFANFASAPLFYTGRYCIARRKCAMIYKYKCQRRRGSEINFADTVAYKKFPSGRWTCDLISRVKTRAAFGLLSDINIRDKCLISDITPRARTVSRLSRDPHAFVSRSPARSRSLHTLPVHLLCAHK